MAQKKVVRLQVHLQNALYVMVRAWTLIHGTVETLRHEPAVILIHRVASVYIAEDMNGISINIAQDVMPTNINQELQNQGQNQINYHSEYISTMSLLSI